MLKRVYNRQGAIIGARSYLHEGVRGHLPLAGNDHGNVHHHKLIARVQLRRPPICDEGVAVGRVVDISLVAVWGEFDQLVARNQSLPIWLHNPEVDQRRLVSPSSEADEDFRGSEAAMVEVGRLAGWACVNQLVVVRHIFSQAGEDDGKVCDWVLVVAGFQADLEDNQVRGMQCLE